MDNKLTEKLNGLKEYIRSLGSVLVSFSGGADSILLMHIALEQLGRKKAAGFLMRSAVQPSWVASEERCVGESMGARILEVSRDMLLVPEKSESDSEKCYACKTELIEVAKSQARGLGLKHVIDGTLCGEGEDCDATAKALKKSGVEIPLFDRGFTKAEVMLAIKELGINIFNDPNSPCLGNRFPTGIKITSEMLDKIAKSEDVFRDKGFKSFRLRYHGNLVRIQLSSGEFPDLVENGQREKIVKAVKDAGFKYVSLDLEGYGAE